MMEKTIDIEELVQDDHNLNRGTEEGQRLMERSFKELGAGRSILVDRDGRIIAGNKSQKAAMAAGIKRVRVVETTGDELIAVKRTDLSLDSKEGRELAYADNLTTHGKMATIVETERGIRIIIDVAKEMVDNTPIDELFEFIGRKGLFALAHYKIKGKDGLKD